MGRGGTGGGAGMFYANIFDPQLILGQIITLQCLWYLALGGYARLPSSRPMLMYMNWTPSAGSLSR